MNEIIKLIERDFKNWQWLVRSNNGSNDKAKGIRYFANLSDDLFIRSMGANGRSYKAYANTPSEALSMSYNLAQQDQYAHPRKAI